MKRNSSSFYFGTSGLVLPVSKSFYPPAFRDKSRLVYYASLYNSIEINSSFYKIPMSSTVSKWAASVPSNFKFTFKLWKGITHEKGFSFKSSDVTHFIKTISSAGSKKGSLLVQFPPSLKVQNIRRLEKLLHSIRKADPRNVWKVALEFRDKSWYNDDTYDLAMHYKMGIVIHDKSSSATPLFDFASSFMYVRFHGPQGNYRGSYSEDFLHEYSAYIKAWKKEGKTVYIYFNNTMGDALNNLNTLKKYLTQRS